MVSAVRQNHEIEQLKTLLFQPEAARLETVEGDVAELRQFVGTSDKLEAATADVLVGALRRAEVDQPRELANAIAPVVVSAIRNEIRNSRDMMVDALYPLAGRLVSAAVANAFKELIASVEARLSALTSMEIWIGRAKSIVTGRPLSEFVLAGSNPLRVKRLLIVERGSGRLIAHWVRSGVPDERADLLGAMVAAILEFSTQAMTESGHLQRLDFGGSELVLRTSPGFILAAECTGPMRPIDDARINSLFFETIESLGRGAQVDAPALASVAASIEAGQPQQRTTSRSGRIALYILLGLVIAGIGWLASVFITRTMLEQRANAALQQLSTQLPLLQSFPLRLDFDHGDQRLVVTGIEPSQLDVAPVLGALEQAAAPYQIVNRIGVLPEPEQPVAVYSELAALQQSLSRMAKGIDEMRAAIAAESKSRGEQMTSLLNRAAALEGRNADLRKDYDALRSTIDNPARSLDRFISSTAIFFGENDAFRDDAAAERQIRELAGLLQNNDLNVRVVGYADEIGSQAYNDKLALTRAQKVMQKIAALGVEPSRLRVVSRGTSLPISGSAAGVNNGNRRVTFENVFLTEPQQ